MGKQPKYPYADGDTLVLGPEIFATDDGSVICWRGVNYIPQLTGVMSEQGDRSMGYNTQGFQGTVMLKDWFLDPINGTSIRGVMGKVTILEAQEMVGFDPGKNEANWIARVDGPSTSYNFPGCQVRCVLDHPGVEEPDPKVSDSIVVAQ